MQDKSEQEEHEYRGWKIKITDKAVDTKSSAMIRVWKPGHDPRSHAGVVVPFRKRAATTAEKRTFALRAAKEWIEREAESR